MQLGDIGEFGLISLINKHLLNNPAGVVAGIGDDAAVLPGTGNRWLLFTTDMLVEGVHFRRDWADGREVGWKALAVNISDIAAMGGIPTSGVVSLGLPPTMTVAEVEQLYDGIRSVAGQFGVNIVGGDTVACPGRLVINIALLGETEPGRAVLRSGARPGHRLLVTGYLGSAAAGLHLLQHPGPYPRPAAEYARRAHLLPEPRVAAGRLLAALEGIGTLDDNSDGLAGEVHEICRASGTGCIIETAQLPLHPLVKQLAGIAGIDPLDWQLFGGEDFELVFSVAPEQASLAVQRLAEIGLACTEVGRLTLPEQGIVLRYGDGRTVPLKPGGFDHFR